MQAYGKLFIGNSSKKDFFLFAEALIISLYQKLHVFETKKLLILPWDYIKSCKRAAQIENGLGKTSKVVKDEIYKVNNVGEWIGENAMGQILTMAKLVLNEGC